VNIKLIITHLSIIALGLFIGWLMAPPDKPLESTMPKAEVPEEKLHKNVIELTFLYTEKENRVF
jgi:hypothetical protein